MIIRIEDDIKLLLDEVVEYIIRKEFDLSLKHIKSIELQEMREVIVSIAIQEYYSRYKVQLKIEKKLKERKNNG